MIGPGVPQLIGPNGGNSYTPGGRPRRLSKSIDPVGLGFPHFFTPSLAPDASLPGRGEREQYGNFGVEHSLRQLVGGPLTGPLVTIDPVLLTIPLYAFSISRVTGLGRKGLPDDAHHPSGIRRRDRSAYADESEWTTLPVRKDTHLGDASR